MSPESSNPMRPRGSEDEEDWAASMEWPADENDTHGHPPNDPGHGAGNAGNRDLWGPPPGYGGPPPGQRSNPLIIGAIAFLAAVLGAGAVLVIMHLTAGPSTSTTSDSPSSGAITAPTQGPITSPGQGTGNGNGSGNSGGIPASGGGLQIFLAGQVTKVSSTSITINGAGNTITAAVTSATKFGGKVSSISQIKVGDFISAQIRGSTSHPVAALIQDPPETPNGGNPGAQLP
jgi:hypothetical protein